MTQSHACLDSQQIPREGTGLHPLWRHDRGGRSLWGQRQARMAEWHLGQVMDRSVLLLPIVTLEQLIYHLPHLSWRSRNSRWQYTFFQNLFRSISFFFFKNNFQNERHYGCGGVGELKITDTGASHSHDSAISVLLSCDAAFITGPHVRAGILFSRYHQIFTAWRKWVKAVCLLIILLLILAIS